MINKFKKSDLILWDWDGTIVDSFPVIYAAHNHVREVFNLKLWTLSEFEEIAHASTADSYPSLYGDQAEEAIQILYKYYIEHHLEQTEFIEGAQEVLEMVQTYDIPMLLVSNKRDDLLHKEVSHFGCENYFQSIVGAGKAQKDKPNSAPVLLAVKVAQMNLKKIKQAFFIGDSQTDIDCAQKLPFETISCLIGDRQTNGENLRFKNMSTFSEMFAPLQ